MPIRSTVLSDASFFRSTKGTSVAGWAAWVRIDGNPTAIRGYGSIHNDETLTSTTAEMYAAINGAWLAKRAGAESALIRSDNMTVIGCIRNVNTGIEMKRIWTNALIRADLVGFPLSARHIKGHGEINDSATWANDWCDKHAKKGMRIARHGHKCLAIIGA